MCAEYRQALVRERALHVLSELQLRQISELENLQAFAELEGTNTTANGHCIH